MITRLAAAIRSCPGGQDPETGFTPSADVRVFKILDYEAVPTAGTGPGDPKPSVTGVVSGHLGTTVLQPHSQRQLGDILHTGMLPSALTRYTESAENVILLCVVAIVTSVDQELTCCF